MTFNDQVKALNHLLEMAEPKRLGRAVTRQVAQVDVRTRDEVVQISGRSGNYHPHITFAGNLRSFGCDCPDKAKQGHKVGPCKHVLALAYEATLNAMLGSFDRKVNS